jgi:uncharacterized protein
MFDVNLILVAAVFALAGFVKGAIGLGLPTIAMGLLAIVMPPVEAAAILILPSLLTNVWQMVAGPSLRSALQRLWPMMGGICVGTWLGMGLMTGAYARYGTAFLGAALTFYALSGLVSIHLALSREREPMFGPLTGAVTGIIAAATGVFVIPAVPYLQAIGLEKEDLVQALGLSFTVSTIALAVNVGVAGGFDVSKASMTLTALAMACAGMWLGQTLRLKLPSAVFRRWFFIGLLLLGIYLVVKSVASLS